MSSIARRVLCAIASIGWLLAVTVAGQALAASVAAGHDSIEITPPPTVDYFTAFHIKAAGQAAGHMRVALWVQNPGVCPKTAAAEASLGNPLTANVSGHYKVKIPVTLGVTGSVTACGYLVSRSSYHTYAQDQASFTSKP